MRICVLSDVHYKYVPDGADDRQNADLVLSFLKDAVGKYDLLVLNGDIFDLWFDWKYAIIKQYFPFLHRLAEIRENGCRLVLISGNHDFWFGDFLSSYLGMEIHDRQFSLQADGRRMLFTHGDLHTVNDLRYKVYRRVIRLTGVRWLFSILHPDFALSLGNRLSRSSRLREISHLLQDRKSTGLVKHARGLISSGKYDLVFMGHSHIPLVKELDGGLYVNSGDWIRSHSYVEVVQGIPELKYYNEKENSK